MSKIERQQLQVELLLRGMLIAVGEEGYENVSVKTVLEKTRLYRQAFYDNFTGKEDCYLQAFDFGVAHVAARVGAAIEDTYDRDWRSRMRAGLAEFLAFCEDQPAVARALIVEVHAAGAAARAKRADVMQKLVKAVDSVRRELPPDAEQPPAIATEGVLSGIHAVVYSRLAIPSDGGPPRFRPLLPELMHLAVLPFFGFEAAAEELRRRA